MKLCYYPCNLYCDQFRNLNQLADFHSVFELTLSQLIFLMKQQADSKEQSRENGIHYKNRVQQKNRPHDLALYKEFSLAADILEADIES